MNIDVYKKLDVIIYFIILMCISLNSYFFNSINLAPLPPIGVILALLLLRKFKKSSLIILFYFVGIFIIPVILGIVNNNYKIYFPTLIGVFLGPFFFMILLNLNQSNFMSLIKAVKYFLVTITFCFYLQTFFFYFLGYEIDYMFYITGEQSRYQGSGLFTGYIRPTSIFNEPATYAMFVFAFSLIYYFYKSKLTMTIIFSVFSLLVTLSSSGFILFLLFILIIVYRDNKILIPSLIVLGVIMSFCFNSFLIDYFDSRYANGLDSDNSTSTRFLNGFEYFYDSNYFSKFFGIGIGYTPDNLDSVVGSGIIANILSFGIFFNILFLYIIGKIFIFYKVGFSSIISFLVLMFSTMTFVNLHFWLFLALFILVNYRKNFKLYNLG